MMPDGEEIRYKTNCFLLFWKTPRTYLVPQAPPGHIYIPLNDSMFSDHSKAKSSYYSQLQNLINEYTFYVLYNNSIEAIKINDCLLLLMILSYAVLITLLLLVAFLFSAELNLAGIILSVICVCIIILIKIINILSQRGMEKKEKRLRKVLKNENEKLVGRSQCKVKAGKWGLWLDFFNGEEYEPADNREPLL